MGVVVLCMGWMGQVHAAQDESDTTAAALDALFQSFHDAGLFSGTALVANDGQVVFAGGYGVANHSWGIPNDVETRYAVASLSKHFTATAILQLVESGAIEIDAPLGEYVDGVRKDVGAVTVRQLLGHTSGLRRDLFEATDDSAIAQSDADRLAALNRTGLTFPQGTRMAYSNAGYCALTMIVESVSEQSFQDYMDERVFAPAGMRSSSFPSGVLPVARLATGYELCIGEPILAAIEDPSGSLGAGGMVTTVGDLHRFERALAEGRVLSHEMQALMAIPGRGGWGLGCQLSQVSMQDGEPSFAVFHNGDGGGFAAHFMRYAPDGFVFVLLSNHWTLPRTALLGDVATILNGGSATPPLPRLDTELFRTVVEHGFEEGVAMNKAVSSTRARDLPGAIHVHMQANMLARVGRLAAAKAMHRYNTAVHPRAWYGIVGLGTVFEQEGDVESAAQCYMDALESFPDNPAAVKLLSALDEAGD